MQIQKSTFEVNCLLNKPFAFDLTRQPSKDQTKVLKGTEHYYIKFFWPRRLKILDYMRLNNIDYLEEIEVVYLIKQLAITLINLSKHFNTKTILKFLAVDNVLVTDELYYDFAEFFVQSDHITPNVSRVYLAFEILQQMELDIPEEDQYFYSNSVIYSIGVIAYRLLFRRFPYQDNETLQTLMAEIQTKESKGLTFPRTITSEFKEVLQCMLTINHEARMTWDQLFCNPLFSYDWAKKNRNYKLLRPLICETNHLLNSNDQWFYTTFKSYRPESFLAIPGKFYKKNLLNPEFYRESPAKQNQKAEK